MDGDTRQQVEAWQEQARGTLWSGYGDDDHEFLDLDDPDDEPPPRRIVRPRRYRRHRRRR
jgi:hypothetical protein